jgi:hypothetical protein
MPLELLIGSLDLLFIDLQYHDLSGVIFPNSKSWRILYEKNEATLIHTQFYQILSRAIHSLNPQSYLLYLELDQTPLPLNIGHGS